MPNTLWLWVFLALSSQGSLSQMLWRWVALKRQKMCTNSEQPPIYGVGGGLFIARRQPDLICPKWPWVTKELTCVQRSDFKHTRQLGLGYKLSWLIQLWIRFALIVFARRHRIWWSITSVTLTLFTWTPLNSAGVPMTQQRRKGNYETTMSLYSIVFIRCLLMS
jgi:hypothetical protein